MSNDFEINNQEIQKAIALNLKSIGIELGKLNANMVSNYTQLTRIVGLLELFYKNGVPKNG